MSLNIVNIQETNSLGFGLDYRTERGNVTNAGSINLYCVNDDVSTTEQNLDLWTGDYYFGSSAESMQISSSNASDNQQVTIYYYSDSTDEEPSIQQATLNGQTAVDLSSDIFRISRILISSASLNAGNVYLYKSGETLTSGVPAGNVLATIEPNIGFSRQSYMYVPASWSAYFIGGQVINNSSETTELNIKAYRYLNHLAPSLRYEVQSYTVNTGEFRIEENLAPGISAGATYLLKASKSNNTNTIKATILYNFVLLK